MAASEQVRSRADTLVTEVTNYTKTLPALNGDNQHSIDYWHFDLDCLCKEVSKIRAEMGNTEVLGAEYISESNRV